MIKYPLLSILVITVVIKIMMFFKHIWRQEKKIKKIAIWTTRKLYKKIIKNFSEVRAISKTLNNDLE